MFDTFVLQRMQCFTEIVKGRLMPVFEFSDHVEDVPAVMLQCSDISDIAILIQQVLHIPVSSLEFCSNTFAHVEIFRNAMYQGIIVVTSEEITLYLRKFHDCRVDSFK